jgi:hypothetical protein
LYADLLGMELLNHRLPERPMQIAEARPPIREHRRYHASERSPGSSAIPGSHRLRDPIVYSEPQEPLDRRRHEAQCALGGTSLLHFGHPIHTTAQMNMTHLDHLSGRERLEAHGLRGLAGVEYTRYPLSIDTQRTLAAARSPLTELTSTPSKVLDAPNIAVSNLQPNKQSTFSDDLRLE